MTGIPRPTSGSKLLDILETVVLAGSVFFLSALMFVNVIARGVGHSLLFGEEIGMLAMYLITFFGVSYAARKARHLRMGAIFDLLSERNQKIMMFITASVTSLVMLYLGYLAIRYTINVQQSGRQSMALGWPFWVFVIWAAVGFFMAGIHYIRTIIKNIKEKEVWLSPEERSEYELSVED